MAEPSALSPRPSEQVVGEVSPAAEAFGVSRGMAIGEALTRCPDLHLVPPDPEAVRERWGSLLDRLEGIGASVESDGTGLAFFSATGLLVLHGGLEGVLRRAREALGGVRLGAGPSRFAAHAAALRARPRSRRWVVVEPERAGRFLAPLGVSLLRVRPELRALPEVLEQLGIRTLGELASLPPRAVAERFGHPGLLALDLAQGRDTPLDPRRPPEPVTERLDLPEAASGQQLERALDLLIARVLARRERRGRSLRSLCISARFVAGGTWRTSVVLRQASAEAARIRTTLSPRLGELPAPADRLALEVEAFGPPAHDQERLLEDGAEVRRSRLREAVRQVRQAAGADAALRVLEVDPGSRLPERRAVLAPFEEGQ
jgi:nucleotidyltransferase/DNA polymerase involved in DNA repair